MGRLRGVACEALGSAGGGAFQGGAGSGNYPVVSDSAEMDEEEVMTRLDLERGILNWVA